MSLAYFPLYADDFEADTAHLTLEEDGAYNRLLRLCWRSPGCNLPNDRAWIYRKMRARTDEEKAVVDIVLDEFFTVENGRVSNARLTKEWLAANAAHDRRKKAGAKGGKAKSLKVNNSKSSNAAAKPKQPEPEPDIKRDTNVSQKKRGSRLPEDWTLPKDWGEWALSEGWPEQAIRAQAERFRDYWISQPGQKAVKVNWKATWRNWMRNSNAPKVYDGGQHGQRFATSERVQRTVTAAARGTSSQDWG